eukprot:scaffold12694_cov141-Skeletonema_marinoi.AAC.9
MARLYSHGVNSVDLTDDVIVVGVSANRGEDERLAARRGLMTLLAVAVLGGAPQPPDRQWLN